MMVKMHLAFKQQCLCPNLNDAVITSLSRPFFSLAIHSKTGQQRLDVVREASASLPL